MRTHKKATAHQKLHSLWLSRAFRSGERETVDWGIYHLGRSQGWNCLFQETPPGQMAALTISCSSSRMSGSLVLSQMRRDLS